MDSSTQCRSSRRTSSGCRRAMAARVRVIWSNKAVWVGCGAAWLDSDQPGFGGPAGRPARRETDAAGTSVSRRPDPCSLSAARARSDARCRRSTCSRPASRQASSSARSPKSIAASLRRGARGSCWPPGLQRAPAISRSRCSARADAAKASTNAVLPLPGSPLTKTTPVSPRSAAARWRLSCSSSFSRATSRTGGLAGSAVVSCWPVGVRPAAKPAACSPEAAPRGAATAERGVASCFPARIAAQSSWVLAAGSTPSSACNARRHALYWCSAASRRPARARPRMQRRCASSSQGSSLSCSRAAATALS